MTTFDTNKVYLQDGELLGRFIKQNPTSTTHNMYGEEIEKPGDYIFESGTILFDHMPHIRNNIKEISEEEHKAYLESDRLIKNQHIEFNKLYDLDVLKKKENFKKDDVIGNLIVLYKKQVEVVRGKIDMCTFVNGKLKSVYICDTDYYVYEFGARPNVEKVSFDALKFISTGGRIKSKRRKTNKRKKRTKRYRR